MRVFFRGSGPLIVAFVALASLTSIPVYGQGQQGVRTKTTGAPDRSGNGTTEYLETFCPPQTSSGVKAPTNNARDADKGGSAATDYFMGEYVFAKGQEDLKVIVWCITGASATPPFTDYFSYEILTSTNGVDTPAVAPNSVPTSPTYPASLPRSGAT